MIYKLIFILAFFLFLLSCKTDDLDYNQYVEQFEVSIQILNEKNDFIYKEFDHCKNIKPGKIRPYFEHLKLVKKCTDDLLYFIDSIAFKTDSSLLKRSMEFKKINDNQENFRINLKKDEIERIRSKILRFKKLIIPPANDEQWIDTLINSIDNRFSDNNLQKLNNLYKNRSNFTAFYACLFNNSSLQI